MLGPLTRSTCAILLALACIHGSSAQLNMNDVCALVYNGLIASYDSCATYFACEEGTAILQQCSAGNYFDRNAQSCVPQAQVQCISSTSAPCSGYDTGSWAPVFGSCNAFYYCSTSGPKLSYCPQGESFDPYEQECVYSYDYECTSAQDGLSSGESDDYSSGEDSGVLVNVTLPVNLCEFIGNGMYFGSASNCSGWNICVNDELQSGNCQNGLLFNAATQECDYPAEVSCSQVTNDPYLSDNTCSTQGAMAAGATCDTYFVCDGTYYQVNQCPNGLFYDTVSQACVNRLEARNDCDRCLGSSSEFVNAYSSSNCTGYLYCQNGVEVSSGVCPDGSYFDESYAGCVVGISDPMYGCCNPAYYITSISESGEDTGPASATNGTVPAVITTGTSGNSTVVSTGSSGNPPVPAVITTGTSGNSTVASSNSTVPAPPNGTPTA